VLLILDVVLGGLIVLALCVASWRGHVRARRTRAAQPPALADLIPGRPAAAPIPPPRAPRRTPSVASSHATWSASAERGETAPPASPAPAPPAPAPPAPAPPAPELHAREAVERPAVVVAPRGPSWVVRRDGASRVSSVHSSRDVAVARGRKTAERERVVLEVRDGDDVVVDRTDYSAGRSTTA